MMGTENLMVDYFERIVRVGGVEKSDPGDNLVGPGPVQSGAVTLDQNLIR